MKPRIVTISILDPLDNRYMCGYKAPYHHKWSLEGWYRKQALKLKNYAKYHDNQIGVRQPKIKVQFH